MACLGRYAPLVRRGRRRLVGHLTTLRRASRLSGSSGASARGAGSQGSVSSGIKSPPVPILPSRREQSGQSEFERPPRGLRARLLPLHHAPPIFRAQNTRAFAFNTPGSPPRAG